MSTALNQLTYIWYLCQRCETLACARHIETECVVCRVAADLVWPGLYAIQGQVSGS